ncbi:MAG: CRISPR-associated endonuclease Cas3'' [Burkholderiaceae bacterium]
MDESPDHWAHSRRDSDGRVAAHGLREHLQGVATRARDGAARIGEPWAWLAGLWHDLGKYRPGFQAYIRQTADAHIEGKIAGPSRADKTHSAAGALHAIATLGAQHGQAGERAARLLAYVIAGHHAGLADWVAGLDQRLLGAGAPQSQREYDEALQACRANAPDVLALPSNFDLRRALTAVPGAAAREPLAWSLWVRLLFSTLVDADFLDTEAFMNAGRADQRDAFQPIGWYLDRLDAHLDAMAAQVSAAGRTADPVMQWRAAVLRRCREQAAQQPGVFTLEVPTGGGKTLSSLAFALRHAALHGKRRVVYAIPYTSIIEQTADVFAGVFGRDAVVEHHSQADGDTDAAETAATRLACENWAAPLVVTTNAQLFESLFAARTSRCRKLHNLTGSVIVLDEAQLLPPPLLQPVLDALRLLVDHYGVTLVLCTATQPALTDTRHFDARRNLRGLPAPRPIVAERGALFGALQRVTIAWPADLQQPAQLPEVAARMADHDCALAVVNTRRDASELLAALDLATGERAIHLSAAMCGQHRADVIADIRDRLQTRRSASDRHPLRVVSTQLVEAGVDIDFPVVFRALAGLDSIAQAAGRCNREGLLDGKGLVEVFVRDIPNSLAALRAGVQATRSTLGAERPDTLDPDRFETYFRHYFGGFPNLDQHGIVDLLRCDADFAMNFRTAAERFRLIDDKDQASLIVPYISAAAGARPIAPLIEMVRSGQSTRWLMRALQRYMVQVRRREIERWPAGDAEEVLPGLFVLHDPAHYDVRRGLIGADDSHQPVLVA